MFFVFFSGYRNTLGSFGELVGAVVTLARLRLVVPLQFSFSQTSTPFSI